MIALHQPATRRAFPTRYACSFRPRQLCIATALALLSILTLPASAQDASTETRRAATVRSYDIGPGSLDSVLTQFARKAGAELSFDASLTRGKTSPGLSGSYTVQEGLERILSGQSLQAVRGSAGSYYLRPAPAGKASVTALSPITITASPEDPYGPTLGLAARRSATATKTDTPILEAPQTINIVSRRQAEMQGAQTVTQALNYTSGVLPAFGGSDSRYDVINARGGLFVREYLDSVRIPFSAYSVSVPQFDPYMLERIEVLQGPASGLFGQSAPGGVVNMVSLRPSADPQHEVMIQGGNLRHRELAVDSTGPLDQDERLLYRLTALGRANDGHTDFSEEKRVLVAPSFTWRPSADTSLTVLTHYQHDRTIPQYQGLPAEGTLYDNPNGKISRKRFSGEPDHERMDREQYTLGYAFEHRANDTWTLRQNLRYTSVDINARGTPGFSLAPDGRTLSRVATEGKGKGSILGIDTQAQAVVRTGKLEHTVLLGLDYLKQRDDYRFASQIASPIDLYDPHYGTPIPELIPRLSTLQKMEQTGLYAQDQIRSGGWVFTAGARYDHAATSTADRINDSTARKGDDAFTGRVGVNYVFDNGLAPYASYSTSFEPTGGTDYSGRPFEASTGKQFEIGVKYQPTSSNMLITLSGYEIRQRNVLTPDAAPGHAGFNTQAGAVRSRGINLEVKAQVGEGTEIIGAYAYTQSKITQANPNALGVSLEGRPLPRVPRHMASLWVNHAFSDAPLSGLSVGAGVRYTGSNYADSATTISLPSLTLWDAAIHYDLGKASPALKGYKLSLTASNLADREYVSYCLNSLQCFYGQGRTVLLGLRKTW